jgi:hypothetical protein
MTIVDSETLVLRHNCEPEQMVDDEGFETTFHEVPDGSDNLTVFEAMIYASINRDNRAEFHQAYRFAR